LENAINKARVLIEALPYIKNFSGATFVIKYGGSAMTDEKYKEIFIQDIILLRYVGIKFIIVHGGGDDITSLAEKLGKKPKFIKGHRVTDKEMLEIVEMVLIGKINKDIVKSINNHNIKAIGISGKDANLIIAKIKNPELGFVGEIKKINPEILKTLQEKDFIPVIAPIGVDEKGQSYNINADLVAGDIAIAVKANKLIYITDTTGVKINGNYAESLTIKDINKYIKKKQITGGMLPKVLSAQKAVEKGVKKVHIINGTIEHSLLLEIFTKKGIGTEIVK